jgi:hypothetical protein
MKLKHSWSLALKALTKNKLQTALTMVGMTIGVATVLTMIALGSGAQSAIQDQVRSAGMNLIVVTAGNYQMKQDKPPDEGIEPAAYIPSAKLPTRTIPAVYYQNRGVHLLRAFHPEDDPWQSTITQPHVSVLAMQRLDWAQQRLSRLEMPTKFARSRGCNMSRKEFTRMRTCPSDKCVGLRGCTGTTSHSR